MVRPRISCHKNVGAELKNKKAAISSASSSLLSVVSYKTNRNDSGYGTPHQFRKAEFLG
jgi:hypothetical protein